MHRLVIAACLLAIGLSVGCAPAEQNFSCSPIQGPRIGEFYQLAPTRDAGGYLTCMPGGHPA